MRHFSSNLNDFFQPAGVARWDRPFLAWMVGLALLTGFSGAEAARPHELEMAQIRQEMAQIDSLLAVEALDLAVEQARNLNDRHGEHPRLGGAVIARLGLVLLRAGKPGEALAHLEKAVRLDTRRPENHRNLGFALLELGRRGRALSEYAQAVELAPREFSFRLEYGQLLLDFGDARRAGDHLLEARNLCGDCAEIQIPLARYFLAARRFEEAASVLMNLPAKDQDLGVRRALIQAVQGAGRDSLLLAVLAEGDLAALPGDEARLLVETEGRLKSVEFSAGFAAALADRKDGGYPSAVHDDPGFWGLVSYNLLLAKRDELALTALDRAINLDDDNVVYRNNRVVLLTRLGRHDEAAEEWDRVLTLDPSLKERNPQ
jgi:tetratricopeptide (TPR) repeat protein